MKTAPHALQAMATLGAVPHLVRLLESANEVIAEGASECLLHIVAPSDGHPAVHPSQLALRSAGAIPSLLYVVRLQSSTPECVLRGLFRRQFTGTSTQLRLQPMRIYSFGTSYAYVSVVSMESAYNVSSLDYLAERRWRPIPRSLLR